MRKGEPEKHNKPARSKTYATLATNTTHAFTGGLLWDRPRVRAQFKSQETLKGRYTQYLLQAQWDDVRNPNKGKVGNSQSVESTERT